MTILYLKINIFSFNKFIYNQIIFLFKKIKGKKMKNIVGNILDIKIDIYNSMRGIAFKNEEIENDFLESKRKITRTINICFSAFFCMIYSYIITYSFIFDKIKNKSNFVMMVSFLFELLSNVIIFKYFITIKYETKKYSIILIRCFLILLSLFLFSLNDPFKSENNNKPERNIYVIILIKNFSFFFICKNCILYIIILTIEVLIFFICCFVYLNEKITNFDIIIGIFFEIFMTVFFFWFKRLIEYLNRMVFSQDFLIENLLIYFEDIFNNFNCLHFSYKNDKILYANKKTLEIIHKFKNNSDKKSSGKSTNLKIELHDKNICNEKKEDNIEQIKKKKFNEIEFSPKDKILISKENMKKQVKIDKTIINKVSYKIKKHRKFVKYVAFNRKYYSHHKIKIFKKKFNLLSNSKKNQMNNNDNFQKKIKSNNQKFNRNLFFNKTKDRSFKKLHLSTMDNSKYRLEKINAEEKESNFSLKEIMKKIYKIKNNQGFNITETNDFLTDISQFDNLLEVYEYFVKSKNFVDDFSNFEKFKLKSHFFKNISDKGDEEKKLASLNNNNESSLAILKNQNLDFNNLNEKSKLDLDDKFNNGNNRNKYSELPKDLSIVDEKIFTQKLFFYLGEFFSDDETLKITDLDKNISHKKYYDIYLRKFSKVTEFLILDKTQNKLAEVTTIENSIKHKIFAKVAHEFKTPLNSILSLIANIKGYLHIDNENSNDIKNNFNLKKSIIQKKNNIEKNLKNDLNVIVGLSNYTMFLISDIIQYSSNDNKEMKIIKESVSLKKIIYFNYEILKALISCNEQKLRLVNPIIEFESHLQDVFLDTDEFRLNQIILNFISNAVKFTKAGKISIKPKLKINSKNNSDSSIIISIHDTGIGIKKDQKNFIFSESEKLNLNYNMNKMGSGLGLSICKTIADILGYKITFESEEKCGTIFSIEIPFALSSTTRLGQLSNLSNLGINQTNIKVNSDESEFLKDLLDCKDKKYYYNEIHSNSSNMKDNSKHSSKLDHEESINFLSKTNLEDKDKMQKFKTTNIFPKINGKSSYFNNFASNKSIDNPNKYKVIDDNSKYNNCNVVIRESKEEKNWIETKLLKESDNKIFLNRTTICKNSTLKVDRFTCSNKESDHTPNKNKNILTSSELSELNFNTSRFDNNKIDFRINSNENRLIHTERNMDCNTIKTYKNSIINNKSSNKNLDAKYYNTNKKYSMDSYKTKNISSELPLIGTPSEIHEELAATILDKSQIMQFDYNKFLIKDMNLNDIDLNITLKQANTSERSQISIKFSNNIVNCKSFTINKEYDSHKLFNDTLLDNEQQNICKSFILDKTSNLSNLDRVQGRYLTNLESDIEKIDLTKKLLIIIDDNKYIRDSLRKILNMILIEKQASDLFEILEGNDGIDLLKFSIDHIYSERIELVITDENMEFMKGSDAIKILRDFEKNNKIPKFIIFSATSFEDKISHDYITNAGADFVIKKPVSKEKLLLEIEKYNIFK